jgi:sterol desaturase/sphingolipid hydroxylase (fatty acid hydroxylase superfamily)
VERLWGEEVSMTLIDVLSVAPPLTFLGLLVLERLVPARPLPHVRWWLAKGIIAFFFVGAANAIVPGALLSLLGDRLALLPLASLGTVGGAVVVVLFGDLLGYWVHRLLHTSGGRAWRWTHQLHHSAERMDMAGASWFHPLDIAAQMIFPTVLAAILFGVTPEAAMLAGVASFFFGVSPHANVRTPRWLGYVLQRPEMHAVHHTRGVHAYNYGVLAFSDLLFGTWRNPATFPTEAYGFWDGASGQLGAMLIGRDVGAPPATASAQPTIASVD